MKQLIGLLAAAASLAAPPASTAAPRDIPSTIRECPESLGASHDGTLYIGSWKGIVYRARPGEVLATPWVRQARRTAY